MSKIFKLRVLVQSFVVVVDSFVGASPRHMFEPLFENVNEAHFRRALLSHAFDSSPLHFFNRLRNLVRSWAGFLALRNDPRLNIAFVWFSHMRSQTSSLANKRIDVFILGERAVSSMVSRISSRRVRKDYSAIAPS